MTTKLLALASGILLAAAPGALAEHGHGHGHGHGGPDATTTTTTTDTTTTPAPGKGVAFVVSGPVAKVDADAGTLTVTVKRTNRHARSFKGHDVVFTLKSARLKVRDVNSDGKRDLGDVAEGDRADVLAKLPRGTAWAEDGSYAAKRVVVHHPKPAGDDQD
jgi:hypothetical protein